VADPGKIMAEALALEPRERAAIVVELLESLDGDPEAEVSSAWDAEIKRRVDQVRDGTVKGDALSDAIAELDEVVDQ
jgi:putative addiction module component (TIGR02574 family)